MGNEQSQQVRLEERAGQTFNKLLESPSLRLDPTFSSVLSKNVQELTLQLQHSSRAVNKIESSQGFSVAHLCCVLRWSEGLEVCLQAGAKVDKASIAGYTPLHLACYFGDVDCCRTLLCHGARHEIKSRRGALAIHFAAQQTSCDVLELIMDGRNPKDTLGGINSLGCSERTPLHLAVLSHGNPGIVNFLIDAGAKVSQRNRSLLGATPLHTAAQYARFEALRSLLQANADPNIPSDRGVLPVQELFLHPHMKHNEEDLRQMLILLRNAGSKVDCCLQPQGYTMLHLCMMVCNEEKTIDLLLSFGLDVRMQTDMVLDLFDPRSKTTMLHKAAKKGWVTVLQKLLVAGADVNSRDSDGLQPLHLAVLFKRPKAIQLLLSSGANPNALACNCYPNFRAWKMRRAMQAMQALMNNPAAEGVQQLHQLFQEPAEEMSAVDMAVCISQHIPSVEVFLKHHAMPSEEAICLAEKDTPIMRTIVQRPLWSSELHQVLPDSFKLAVAQLLRCLHRATYKAGVHLSESVMGVIINQLAYPVSDWADSTWLAAQHIARSEADEQAAAEQHADVPPGFPQYFGAALHQLQQDLAHAIGEVQAQGPAAMGEGAGHGPQEEDSDDEGGQAGNQMGQHPGLAGLLGGLGAGFPVPQMVQHHEFGNMQVIQMEFNVAGFPPDLPGVVFHAGPHGLLPVNFNIDLEDEGDSDEEGEGDEDQDGYLVSPEQDGLPLADLMQQQQQPDGSHLLNCKASDGALGSLDADLSGQSDSDVPGPSTGAGSKRRTRSSSQRAGTDTCSAGKKLKRE